MPIAQALNRGDGPRYSLHASASYRECNEDLIFLTRLLHSCFEFQFNRLWSKLPVNEFSNLEYRDFLKKYYSKTDVKTEPKSDVTEKVKCLDPSDCIPLVLSAINLAMQCNNLESMFCYRDEVRYYNIDEHQRLLFLCIVKVFTFFQYYDHNRRYSHCNISVLNLNMTLELTCLSAIQFRLVAFLWSVSIKK